MPRWVGSATAPSGFTWSTSTPHSGAAPTANCSPTWSASSTCGSSCPGGIRDDASLAAALATGCARVNLGTAALENPQWCARVIAEHGDKVAVGLDVHIVDGRHRLRGRGWETDGGDLWEVLERLDRQGCSRFVVTDVSKDGTLRGPNLDLLRQVADRTEAPVIASGGVSSLDDLRAIATLAGRGVEGAIVGKALYAGRFTLPQALAAVRE